MRARAGLLACAAALVALAGCQIEREQVLPWLLKENIHAAFGGFGGSTHSTYSTRHWGSWRGLDVWETHLRSTPSTRCCRTRNAPACYATDR